MKRFRVAVAALAATMLAAVVAASPALAANGYVARSGTSIVDRSGKTMKLDAVNLGGHLMWEGWIIGGGMDAETSLFTNLSNLVGPTRAAKFRADMRMNFVTLADFEAIKRMGFNSVRLPFNHRVLANDAGGGFAMLDRLLSYAERTGVYVVLDMHGVPGGQNGGFIADPGPGWYVWYDQAARDKTVALWRTIAARYANRPIVAGYDLVNEPDAPSGEALMDLYKRIVAGIRSVDKNHMVIIEGNKYAHDFTGFSRIDENLAYSFHQYPWDSGDADASLSQWVQAAESANVPLWNGEYGEAGHADVQGQVTRFGDRPEIDGQSLWTWKKADRNRFFGFVLGTNPAPVKFTASDAWLKVMHYMSSPGNAPKPTAAEAEAGLQSFITAVQYANTKTDAQLNAVLEPFHRAASVSSGA